MATRTAETRTRAVELRCPRARMRPAAGEMDILRANIRTEQPKVFARREKMAIDTPETGCRGTKANAESPTARSPRSVSWSRRKDLHTDMHKTSTDNGKVDSGPDDDAYHDELVVIDF